MSKKRQLFIRFGHKYASSSKLAIHFVSRRGAKGDGSFWPLRNVFFSTAYQSQIEPSPLAPNGPAMASPLPATGNDAAG